MTPAKSPIDAAKKGIQYMSAVQTEDGTKNSTIHYTHTFLGHWAGDYGGPMFLMPGMVYYSNICSNHLGLIITCYVTGAELKPEQKREMIRYLITRQNQKDGGWGMYVVDSGLLLN